MKLLKTLLCACFLLITASVVGAAELSLPTVDETVPASEAPAVEAPAADAVAPVKEDCNAEADPFQNAEWMGTSLETGLAPQSCGSCSSANCNGAIRGQMCWTGSGWGNCNIYSGGYRCSTGGWECQCGTGPLP